jgi:transcriptional regulator with XRE-family HTH domain
MERAQLLAVRLQKGWTREQAAGYLEVDPATIKRWERGTARPQPLKLQKLCTVYGKTPQELDLAEGAAEGTQAHRATLEDTTGDAYMAFRTSDLTMRLFRLVWNYPNHTARYHELQMIIIMELEDNEMSNESITRRDALCRLAILPIEMGGLSAINAVFKLSFEDILTQCAAGITACWYLRKGKDLKFVSETISKYVPTLKAITLQGNSQQQKAAADLLAQGLLLKAHLAKHLTNTSDAIHYIQQAEYYSEQAQNSLLQIAVVRMQDAEYGYANHWGKALQAAEKATYLLEKAKKEPLPPIVFSWVYSSLAVDQAYHGKKDDALASLQKAHTTFFAQSPNEHVPIWIRHSMGCLLLNDGLTHLHLGRDEDAFNAFEQVADRHASSEVMRVEATINLAMTEASRDDQTRDMDRCIKLWKQGITGAKSLNSEEWFSESVNAYKAMRAAWPHEKEVKDLRYLLLQ